MKLHSYSRKIWYYSIICMVLSVLSLSILLYRLVMVAGVGISSAGIQEYSYVLGSFLAIFIPSAYLPFYRVRRPFLTIGYFFTLVIWILIGFNAGLWVFLAPAILAAISYGSVYPRNSNAISN